METEKKVVPTAFESARIFMCYPDNIVYPRDSSKYSFIPFQLRTISVDGWVWYEVTETEIEIEKCSLSIKPLSRISVKEAAKCWRQYTNNQFSNSEQSDVENGLMLIRELFIHEEDKYTHHTRRIIMVIDFLRQQGYALPWGKWSVEELIEFGVYKIIE